MDYKKILDVVESYDSNKRGLLKFTGEPSADTQTFGSDDIVSGTTQDKSDEVLADMLKESEDDDDKKEDEEESEDDDEDDTEEEESEDDDETPAKINEGASRSLKKRFDQILLNICTSYMTHMDDDLFEYIVFDILDYADNVVTWGLDATEYLKDDDTMEYGPLLYAYDSQLKDTERNIQNTISDIEEDETFKLSMSAWMSMVNGFVYTAQSLINEDPPSQIEITTLDADIRRMEKFIARVETTLNGRESSTEKIENYISKFGK